MKFSSEAIVSNKSKIPNISKSSEIKHLNKLTQQNEDLLKLEEKESKTQKRMDIQSIIDMCTKKLEIDPTHKKALLLRASSYIKNKDFDNVNFYY